MLLYYSLDLTKMAKKYIIIRIFSGYPAVNIHSFLKIEYEPNKIENDEKG
jgi:hypothetical protein